MCFGVCVNKFSLHGVIYKFIWKFCLHMDVATGHVLLLVGVVEEAIILSCRVMCLCFYLMGFFDF